MRKAIILQGRNFPFASVPRATQAISAIFSQVVFSTEFPALPRGAVVSAHLQELHTAKDGWRGTILLGRTGLRRETCYSEEAEIKRDEARLHDVACAKYRTLKKKNLKFKLH